MPKSKQPEFMVGDKFEYAGKEKMILQEEIKERVFRVTTENGRFALMTVSELAEYEHLRTVPRPAHRPKGSGKKTVKIETAPPDPANKPPPRPFVGGIPQGMGNPDKQASTPEVVSPTPAHTDEAPKNEPVPFDPATFTMKVGPPCVMSVSGKTWTGGRLRETLTNLLAFYGITGSPAELKAKLVLNYPDSQGLREMLSILKGGTK